MSWYTSTCSYNYELASCCNLIHLQEQMHKIIRQFIQRNLFACICLGLGVLLIMLPLNAIIWYVMEGFQVKQMQKKDERVRLITEILSGIKVREWRKQSKSHFQKHGRLFCGGLVTTAKHDRRATQAAWQPQAVKSPN